MTPRWGFPFKVPSRSAESVIIVEPTLGLDSSQPSVDAPLGSTPDASNYILREGGIEPRPMLSLRNLTPQPFGTGMILGAHELVSVTNSRTPIVSTTTRMAVYGQSATPNGWSLLSYVSANGISDPPTGADTEYWDFTQIYDATADDNLAVGANGSYQTLYVTQSNSTLFSTLTGAPRAKFVTTFNNYVLGFNIREGSADLVQRVRWSDRGNPRQWVPGSGTLAGFEDLLDMKGQGTRIVGQENQIILFSDSEIWRGVPRDYPFTFTFQPLDRSVGGPYSWTIEQTPLGLIWLGKDYQVYLLPKGGGAAQPIGQRLHRSIRNAIDRPERAWAVYDHTLSQYQLYYPIRGGSGRPQRAVYLDINSGSWAPQSFDLAGGQLSLTRGCEIYVSSSATTWGGLQAQNVTWASLNATWAELGGSSEERAVLVGSSAGTLYTLNSNTTSDNGTAVQSYWRSTGLGGEDPTQQKRVTETRVDYQADSASYVTIRYSQTQGASFGASTRMDLPAASSLSQGIAYPNVSARYPMMELSSEGVRYRLFRIYNRFRRGGR